MALKLLFSAWFRGKTVHFVPICGYEELFWRIKIYSFLLAGCSDLVTQQVTLAFFLLLVCALSVFIHPYYLAGLVVPEVATDRELSGRAGMTSLRDSCYAAPGGSQNVSDTVSGILTLLAGRNALTGFCGPPGRFCSYGSIYHPAAANRRRRGHYCFSLLV